MTFLARLTAHPLVRLAVYLVVLAALMISLVSFQFRVLNVPTFGASAWFNLVSIALFAGTYVLLVRLLERRPVSELSRVRSLPELGVGMLIQGGLMTIIIGCFAALGAYSVIGTRLPADILATTTLMVFVAVNEEIGFRAVIFRHLEEWSGSWSALVLSAILFGIFHLDNENGTILGTIGITLESGLLYAALFMITRRLWAVIGAHFAWNMVEGPIFGTPVSGYEFASILASQTTGPEWLTGGSFGPEGSVIAMLLGFLSGLVALVVAYRGGHFVAPRWRRDPSVRFPYQPIA